MLKSVVRIQVKKRSRMASVPSPVFRMPTIAPTTSAMTSAYALRIASTPSLYRLLSVVAAAIPDGNASCSWLIICRFIGIARNTPSAPVSSVKEPRIVPGVMTMLRRR